MGKGERGKEEKREGEAVRKSRKSALHARNGTHVPSAALVSLVCTHASEIRSAFSHKESGEGGRRGF